MATPSSQLCRFCRLHVIPALLVSLAAALFSNSARGQGLELGGGWAYASGYSGTNGFDVGAAWWFTKRVTIAGNYDQGWNTSTLSTFAFTKIGAIAVKSHLQNALFGPRIFFTTDWTTRHRLNPFGEAQFGVSHLNQKVTQVNMPSISASDTAFSWMLGGGAEYLLTRHWSARGNLDFLRTHFSNEGQSHLRLVLGMTYTFGSREIESATRTRTAHQHAVATGEATVHFTSSPTGGEIYVDGKFVGNTPSDMRLPAGEHSIKVLVGGKEWIRTIQITPGDIRIDAQLTAP
jgi:opacity protein-like surface antigen